MIFPFPRIFNSLWSRLVVSFMIFLGLFQLLAILQFLILPHSGFNTLAIFITAALLIASLVPKPQLQRQRFLTRRDLWASVSSLFFIVPVLVFCFGVNGIEHTASIGGIQGIDGVNHSVSIPNNSVSEHLTYIRGNYYPSGFYLGTAFIQESFSIKQGQASFSNGAYLYILQYLIYAYALSFILFYFLKLVISTVRLKYKNHPNDASLALSLGIPLSAFYLYSFLYNGFLTYFYILASVICAYIYLTEFILSKDKIKKQDALSLDSTNAWLMYGFLLLIFGASASWPLLAPPLILSGMLALYPKKLKGLLDRRVYLNYSLWVVILLFVIQLLPIYVQIVYAPQSNNTGINASGALKVFNSVLFATTIIGFMGIMLSGKVSHTIKKITSCIFGPLLLFVCALAGFQFFYTGELRYFVIKLTFVVNILALIGFIGFIAARVDNLKITRFAQDIFVILCPVLLFFCLIFMNTNPLRDIRSLFRTYSKEPKPQYFDEDVHELVGLGKEGKIDMSNSTILHYQSDSDKVYAHMQLPFWANAMQYDANEGEIKAINCIRELYNNLSFGTFSLDEQKQAIATINHCSEIARANNRKYYIVTDAQSLPHLKELFKGNVNIEFNALGN